VSRAQQKNLLGEEQVRIARQLVSYIEERINAGALSAADGARARVVLAAAEIEQYRTLQELYSPRGTWKPGALIQARVITGRYSVNPAVADDALHNLDNQTVIFVGHGDKLTARPVETGRSDKNRTEIIKGLKAGEEYVSSGGFILKAERQKNLLADTSIKRRKSMNQFIAILSNSSTVIDAVEKKLQEISETLPDGIEIVPFYEQKSLVDASLHTVTSALLQGIVLVLLVLLLFALVISPVVSSLVMRKGKSKHEQSLITRALERGYEPLIKFFIHYRAADVQVEQ
jgi:hypothetical protein